MHFFPTIITLLLYSCAEGRKKMDVPNNNRNKIIQYGNNKNNI